ncbi:hypothetical protein ACFE04_022377 [Oxalis oulophora]
MEVLPCSDVQYAGNSDSMQKNSESNCFESEKQVQTPNGRDEQCAVNGEAGPVETQVQTPNGRDQECPVNGEVGPVETQVQTPNGGDEQCPVNGEAGLIETQVQDEEMIDALPLIDGPLWSDYLVEGPRMSSSSQDFVDDDVLITQNNRSEPFPSSNNSHLVIDTIESDISSNNRDDGSSVSEPKWLENDESVALWFKWRSKWQTGIRCPRADWPLPTVKAKPTHDRKQYIVMFFPHNRNFLWVDALVVRPLDDFPEPIAYRTHEAGLKLVTDLTVARRYIMKNLAIAMLNIVDQFHSEAFVETARNINIWKEFAMESSRCNRYSDLGKMLLKLQSMILPQYMSSDWLQQSSNSWAQRCQNAHTAETTELLKEELFDSIMWTDVRSLWDASVQHTLSSEWRTWKSEVMKWFSTSHPAPEDFEQTSTDGDLTNSFPVSRKRPKLEIRRAESHSSQIEPICLDKLDTDTKFFNQDPVGSCVLEPQTGIADRWDDIIVEPENSEPIQTESLEIASETKKSELTPGTKSRQCTAFIESKGRQCVRWANEGDVYCCVHLASRFLNTSKKSEGPSDIEMPLCGGTTILGTRCKHRSLPGTAFCKKHEPRDEAGKQAINTPENKTRFKHEEIITPVSDISKSQALVVVEGAAPTSSLCIGSSGIGSCNETPKRHSLYCDDHVPSWLKRARNGRSRIISKEVFISLLSDCSSVEQKFHLHQACELFYKLFKSILSLRNPVPLDVQLGWALSEAGKNSSVGKLLMKLVCSEKERLQITWNFGANEDANMTSSANLANSDNLEDENEIKCKICSGNFLDDNELAVHWIGSHKKEAQLLFKGYVCAICLDTFTSKKKLESHVQQRHHVDFVEQCMLLQCIPCKNHFGNAEELWAHVQSAHPRNFRTSNVPRQQIFPILEQGSSSLQVIENPAKKLEQASTSSSAPVRSTSEDVGSPRRFVCRFCGLKFNLLPDLGRHHQAAHMAPSVAAARPLKKGIRQYAYKLKSGRLSRPKFKKSIGQTSYIRNHSAAVLKKHIPVSTEKPEHPCVASPVKLAEPNCSSIAKIIFSEAQRTKPRPSNSEIINIARSACCKESLITSLEQKYGEFPERLYLKAAKLCSEQNIQVQWHGEGFICPKGCNFVKTPLLLSPLTPLSNTLVQTDSMDFSENVNKDLEMDECHYIINSRDLGPGSMPKVDVLCADISFGQESVPVVCVLDERLSKSLEISADNCNGAKNSSSMPWESFTYITKPMLDQSLDLDSKSLQLGCTCSHTACSPEACDHVYLFDNDYEDAKDIYGRPMCGRFPYDDKRRIILEEGYLVYECNYLCNCNQTCPNRVLQNGVQVKLEVFKTENKGWAVRTGEPILRGMFVCEWIGEVLDKLEANNRQSRYGKDGCGYMYNVNAQINDMSRIIEGQTQYVIDATKYGNVSRFINHSCSPNLVNHQVLVDGMDAQHAHIGLYASRDIAMGEELSIEYHNESPPGESYPCLCGTPKCRG